MRAVRVKREGVDSRVPDDDKSVAFTERDAAVKTENMEVSCKEETPEALGGALNAVLLIYRTWV